MKRYIVLLLSLLMVASLCACGQKQQTPVDDVSGVPATTAEPDTSSVEAALNTPSETDAAFEEKQEGEVTVDITPPEGWTPVEGSAIPVHYLKGTASFMVKAEPFTSSTLDEVVTEALGIYQQAFDNLIVEQEAEPFTVDEKDARKLTFTCTVSGISMKFLYVYLFAADKTYVITFGDMESTFDELSSDYETILSSIRFVVQ